MEQEIVILYIVASFIGMILFAWVLSWFFQPGKKMKHLNYQSNVLKLLAEKEGVDAKELEGVAKKIFV